LYIFDQLRGRLAELTESLFEQAPYSRWRFQGAGTRLATLCRGPATGDEAVQEFQETWPFLLSDTQRRLREEWEFGIIRLLHKAKDPCRHCNNSYGDDPLIECPHCAHKVASVSGELEVFAREFTERLKTYRAPPQPEPQPPTDNATVPDQAETIQALEAKCQSYQESLDEIQKALENTANEKAALDVHVEELARGRDALQQTCQSLETELRECVDNIEKFAEDLDIGMRWETAQIAYAVLCRYSLARRGRLEDIPTNEQMRRDMMLKALEFKHKQVVALMRLGRHFEAEQMAKEVWDERKGLQLPANNNDILAIRRDYSDILRRNGKLADAEREYIYLWYDHVGGEEWRLETATRIGEVMAEQKKFSGAALWHKIVLDSRFSRNPFEVEKAAAAAAQCLHCQNQQGESYTITDNTIIGHLERIWLEKADDSQDVNILACGNELGSGLMKLAGRDDEAARILTTVWQKRRALGPSFHSDAMETALLLVDLSVRPEYVDRQDVLDRLETLYIWIFKNPTREQSENDRLWFQYRLAVVQAKLKKTAVAEEHLQKVLSRQTQLFTADDPDTLQFTQVLADVIRRQDGRLNDARTLVRNLWDRRDRYPRSTLQAKLRIGALYADILMESNATEELRLASTIFKEVWDSTTANMAMMPLEALAPAADSYAQCLMKRGKYSDAKMILEQAIKCKIWWGLDKEEVQVSRRLSGKAIELKDSRK